MSGEGVGSHLLTAISGVAGLAALFGALASYGSVRRETGALQQEAKEGAKLAFYKRIAALLFTVGGLFVAQFYLGLFPTDLIPSPSRTASAFFHLLFSAAFLGDVLSSLGRIFAGFSLAILVGTTLGLFGGAFLLVRSVLGPVTSFLRYIPPTAFIALFIVYFGVSETYKIAVVFFGVLFFIIQMVFDVVDDLDRRYYEMGKVSGLTDWGVFTQIIVPASWPRVIDVWRINLGAAWTFLVAAEIVGANRGLGHLLAISQRFNQMPQLFACILTFGLIGLLMDSLLKQLSRRLFPWHRIALRQ